MTSDLSPAISVRRLSKSFSVPRLKARGERPADPRRRPAGWRDRFDVLRDLTFEIPRGQAVGVIGPNGSGKTTLLKILAGVMNADSGEMKIGGRVGALLEVGAGFHPDLAGEENVQLNGALLGISRAEMSRHLAEIIAFAGLERYMDMPVRHYSSGMIVRLGFATAIQLRPDILLLDETFAVGDAEFQGKAFRRIREMKSAGVTMMLVSHNAEQLLQLADRVIWIDKGQIAMDGAPHEVLSAYRRMAGGIALGGEKIVSRLLGQAEGLSIREGARPVKIRRARIARDPKNLWAAAEDNSRSVPPCEIGSSDPLTLEIELEVEAATESKSILADYVLDVYFKRDDRREVAVSRAPLAELPSGAESFVPFTLVYDSIYLCEGTYELTLTLSRREDLGTGQIDARLKLADTLRITTPSRHDFRLTAEVAGRWE